MQAGTPSHRGPRRLRGLVGVAVEADDLDRRRWRHHRPRHEEPSDDGRARRELGPGRPGNDATGARRTAPTTTAAHLVPPHVASAIERKLLGIRETRVSRGSGRT